MHRPSLAPPARRLRLRRGRRSRGGRRRGGRRGLAAALLLVEAGRLALQLAQVEEAGAADLAVAEHLDLVDARAVHREHALDADAVAHLPHGEHRAAGRALPVRHHDALEDLDALLVAFLDLRVDADRVARPHLREVLPSVLRLDVGNRLAQHVRALLYSSSSPASMSRRSFSERWSLAKRSGLRSRVARSDSRRRHRSIRRWSPERRTSGTFIPRNSGGLV